LPFDFFQVSFSSRGGSDRSPNKNRQRQLFLYFEKERERRERLQAMITCLIRQGHSGKLCYLTKDSRERERESEEPYGVR